MTGTSLVGAYGDNFRPVPKRHASRKMLSYVVTWLILTLFTYVIIGDHMASNIRLPTMAVIFVPMAMIGSFYSVVKPQSHTWVLLTTLLLVAAPTALYSAMTPDNMFEFMALVRFIVTMLTVIFFWEIREQIPERMISWIVPCLLLFIVIWSLTQPAYYMSGDLKKLGLEKARIAPFQDGPHVSAFVTMAIMTIIHQLYLSGRIRPIIAWPLILTALGVIYGYRSSQVIFTTSAYIGCYFLFLERPLSRVPIARLFTFTLLGGLVVAAIIIQHESSADALMSGGSGASFGIEYAGSGRIGVWLSRLNIISNRDLATIFFGSGPGSDLMQSEMWGRLAASHNTFITVTIEYGLVGLTMFIISLCAMLKILGPVSYPFVAAIVASCIVSNGLPMRGTPSPLLFLALAIAANRKFARHSVRLQKLIRIKWRSA